jgi:hypothetical protein
MKVILRLAAVVTLISVVQVVRAADVTGTWKGAFDFQGDSVSLTLNLKSDGKTVTGTVVGLPTTPADIHDGMLAGDTLTFWVNSDYQGQTYKLLYKGKVGADQIVFDFGTEDGSWSSPLTVKKGGDDTAKAAPAAADVDGNWKGSFDFDGNEVPVTFHLKKSADAVTGTIDGLGPAPVDLHEGKVEGDTLTFWVNTDYQGQTYMLMYKGKVSADRIDFTFGTVDGSWGSAVTAKKAS